jgi:hypothetical protein
MSTNMLPKALAVLVSAFFACGSTVAAGVGKMTITTTGDQFDNSGSIEATAKASGGVSTAIASQRVIAPVLAITFDYRSSGNRYKNTGRIAATSSASGGVATAVAAQDVVH